MTQTDNHEYHVPPFDTPGWAAKLNANFTAFETDIPLHDTVLNIDPAETQAIHTPHDGAWILTSDTAEIHTGDGTAWHHLASVPKPQTATFSGDGSQTTFTATHNTGRIPRHIDLTPTSRGAAGARYVENKTDTTFDITFVDPPASGTDNITFDVAVVA